MKKIRSHTDQAVVLARVSAAMRLQQHRPKAHADKKKYDRNRAKRLWQKDQKALFSFSSPDSF